jgi:diacylglycerol O-acyltransferase
MNELETMMWRFERHPAQSSTITGVMLLDSPPDWDRLVAAHQWGTQLIGRCRQRVVEPVLPVGPPAWVFDEHFSLDCHLRATLLPGDPDLPALMRFAESFAVKPLDRTRPLCEAVVVQNLSGGRAAYIIKMHHCLTDGMGSMQLLSLVQSRTRAHTPDKPLPAPSPSHLDQLGPVRLAANDLAGQITALPHAAKTALAAAVDLSGEPLGQTARIVRYAASLRRMLSAPSAPPSPLLANRTGREWRFAALECGLEQLRAAAKSAEGSVNDAFIAALLGGLRRYHEAHDVGLSAMPMAMPLSVRTANDPPGGNKFAGDFFSAPIGVVDPVERIRAVRRIVLSLRNEPALNALSLLAPVLNRALTAIGCCIGAFGRADISASNLPGLTHEVFMAGARVDRMYPFAPLPGVAVMAALASHVGVCCIGLNVDGTAIPDHDEFVACMRDGLAEVLTLSPGTGSADG